MQNFKDFNQSDAHKLFNLTMNRNAKIDDIVTSVDINLPTYKSEKVCGTTLKKEERDTIWDKFMGLNE